MPYFGIIYWQKRKNVSLQRTFGNDVIQNYQGKRETRLSGRETNCTRIFTCVPSVLIAFSVIDSFMSACISHCFYLYGPYVRRVPYPSLYYWSLPAEIIMLRNNERHMVMLQLLTRIIIAGIDYMPFWAANGVNRERTCDMQSECVIKNATRRRLFLSSFCMPHYSVIQGHFAY